MPIALRIVAESTVVPEAALGTGRPLFVPAGIAFVRTGPTTQAELDRLLADADSSSEHSGVRSLAPSTPWGLLRSLAAALGLAR